MRKYLQNLGRLPTLSGGVPHLSRKLFPMKWVIAWTGGLHQFAELPHYPGSTTAPCKLTDKWLLWRKSTQALVYWSLRVYYLFITRAEGTELRFRLRSFIYIIFVLHLICKPPSHAFWAWLRVIWIKAIWRPELLIWVAERSQSWNLRE